jgi:hypothetical protein
MPTNLARKRSIEPMTAVPPANDGFDRAADARLIERARRATSPRSSRYTAVKWAESTPSASG